MGNTGMAQPARIPGAKMPAIISTDGACATERPGVDFIPEEHYREIRAAGWCRKHCSDTVREACLNYALSFDSHGAWGGTTRAERRVMRGELTPEQLERLRETRPEVLAERAYRKRLRDAARARKLELLAKLAVDA